MHHRYHKTKPILRKKVSKNMTNPRKMGVRFPKTPFSHIFLSGALKWSRSKYSPYPIKVFSFAKTYSMLTSIADIMNRRNP